MAGEAKAKNFVREADAMEDCCIFGAGPGVVFLMAAIMADLFGVLRPEERRDESRLYKGGW